MVATPGVPTEGGLSVELSRVWDLKKTGQVSVVGKGSPGICCVFFHPIDPTLCVITVQGPQSVLCFYNAVSGGKLATVNLRGVALAASFTNDGRQVVVAFRDWRVLTIKTGGHTWAKNVIFRKKDPKPSDRLLLSLNPAPKPVIFLAAYNQPKLYIIYGALMKSKKSRLRSGEQKTYNSLKLEKQAIVGLSGHPHDVHQMLVMFNDGTVQGLLIEQNGIKRIYSVGDPSTGGPFGSLTVMPHPFLLGSILVLVASSGMLSVYESSGRAPLLPSEFLTIRDIRRVHGMGIDKASNLLLVFGETSNGVLRCFAARIAGAAGTTGLRVTPIPAEFSHSATDFTQGKSGSGNNIHVAGDSGGWMDLWGATPAWAQGSGQIGAARPRIKSVQFHPMMGAMAAQVSASSGATGPHVLMWGMSDESHPLAGAASGIVAPMHTSLEFWGGEKTTDRTRFKLKFPHHFYFLEENKLRSYALATGTSTDLQAFNPASGSQTSGAECVVSSALQRAWLVFFRKSGAGKEQWVYILIREDEVGTIHPWFNPGISGAFMGYRDDFFAILQPDHITVKIYSTPKANGSEPPVMTIPLPSPGLLTPVIFPGPPIFQLPLPNANDDEPSSDDGEAGTDLLGDYDAEQIDGEGEEVADGGQGEEGAEGAEEKDVKTGYGVLLWINKFRQIVMGSLVVEGMQAEGGEGVVEGFIVGELADGEVVVQVSWQRLIEDIESAQQPNASVCALLTNQRAMLFLANGYPIASYPPRNSRGLATPPTSCIWVGPALLYLTQSGEVMQLLWDGSTAMICGAPSTTGTLLLAAVLADRILFLARDPDTWTWQTTSRHAYVGHALLMGWGSLGASGLMPPEWMHTRVRGQFRAVSENFDTSAVSVPVARALVRSGYADVAKAVTDGWPYEADAIKVACSVAAGEWGAAEKGLLKEHQASVYYPSPSPKGSDLWKRLFSTALGAVSRGHWDVAVKLLEAAGEWEHALVVAGLAVNGDTIRMTTASAKQHVKPSRAAEIERLKEQLLKATQLSAGAPPLTKPDESLLGDSPGTWTLATAGTVPAMETVLGETPSGLVKDGNIGKIAPLDRKDIKGYVFGASRMSRGPSMVSSMRFSTASMSELTGADRAESGVLEPIGDMLQVGTANESDDEGPGGRGGNIMHDFKDLIGDNDFSSSDDEGDSSTKVGGGMMDDNASDAGGGFGKRFKIQIKARDDAQATTSADALRNAAKNLRLGGLGFGPSLGPGGFAQALKGATGLARQDSLSSVSSSGTAFDVLSTGDPESNRPPSLVTVFSGESNTGGLPRIGSGGFLSGAPSPGLPGRGLLPPPSGSRTVSPLPLSPTTLSPPVPSQLASTQWEQFDPFDPFSQPPVAQPAPVEDAKTSFGNGVSLMEAGKWVEAEKAFSQCISAPGSPETSGKAKQYLAAVLFMKGRTGMPPMTSARLNRYAVALKLEEKHTLALMKSSIKENMEVQNYAYAAEKLTSLITSSIGTVSSQVAATFQDQLNECDRQGAKDANIPADEDTSSFTDIVGLAGNASEVETTVQDVIRG
ncbi:hypothetical protein BSKO_08206 [Bryopsis sp. KO-2023]|nr:hypothetical protein BSKO_08206 [Bryopsis sp. KO-2023]